MAGSAEKESDRGKCQRRERTTYISSPHLVRLLCPSFSMMPGNEALDKVSDNAITADSNILFPLHRMKVSRVMDDTQMILGRHNGPEKRPFSFP